MQVCVKFRGRTYNGVINAVPEGPAPGGRQGPRHTGSGYMDTAAGLSSVRHDITLYTRCVTQHDTAAPHNGIQYA